MTPKTLRRSRRSRIWSHHDGKTSLALLLGAGFEVKRAETRTTSGPGGDESWLWILTRKGG
jgi:hypothetical protein